MRASHLSQHLHDTEVQNHVTRESNSGKPFYRFIEESSIKFDSPKTESRMVGRLSLSETLFKVEWAKTNLQTTLQTSKLGK